MVFVVEAEVGIRGWSVTGVQTCALPISAGFEDRGVLAHRGGDGGVVVGAGDGDVDVMGCGAVEGCDDEVVVDDLSGGRSEEHTSELQAVTNLVCRLLRVNATGAVHGGGSRRP